MRWFSIKNTPHIDKVNYYIDKGVKVILIKVEDGREITGLKGAFLQVQDYLQESYCNKKQASPLYAYYKNENYVMIINPLWQITC